MYIDIFLFAMLVVSFTMVIAKRITALINGFCLQSLLLFMITLYSGFRSGNFELYVVAGLLFLLKVILIPYLLRSIAKSIKMEENIGLFVNPVLSLSIALVLTYCAYLFISKIAMVTDSPNSIFFIVSLSVVMIGFLIMIFRLKALAQIIGLVVIENGLFLLATSISGGMPFFVEIAIFFDIFVCVIILGIFVYRINKLFTHVDVNKLKNLRG